MGKGAEKDQEIWLDGINFNEGGLGITQHDDPGSYKDCIR